MVSWTLAQSLRSLQGGSNSRILETIGKLQILQNFSDFSKEVGNTDLAQKANPLYVGLESPTFRLESKKKKDKKNGEKELGKKGKKDIKIRQIEDRLQLVVASKSMENKCVH